MTNPDEVKDKFYYDLDDVFSATSRADKLFLHTSFIKIKKFRYFSGGSPGVVDKSILHCSLGCSYKIRKARD